MPSSYNANSADDLESIRSYWAGEQPSSTDLARKPKEGSAAEEKTESPSFEKKEDAGNPYGENSHSSNDPKPKKDGADNTPLKDGSKSPFPHKPSK